MIISSAEVLEGVPRFAGQDHHRRFLEFFITRMDLSAELRIIRKAGVSLVEIGMQTAPAARWYRASLNQQAVILRLGEVTEVWPATLPEVDVHARRIEALERQHVYHEELYRRRERHHEELESQLQRLREELQQELKTTKGELMEQTNARNLLGGAFNVKEKALEEEAKANRQLSVTIVELRSRMHDMDQRLAAVMKKAKNTSDMLRKARSERDVAKTGPAEAQQFADRLTSENEALLRHNESLMRENYYLRHSDEVSPPTETCIEARWRLEGLGLL